VNEFHKRVLSGGLERAYGKRNRLSGFRFRRVGDSLKLRVAWIDESGKMTPQMWDYLINRANNRRIV
jgi:hypothetical protein